MKLHSAIFALTTIVSVSFFLLGTLAEDLAEVEVGIPATEVEVKEAEEKVVANATLGEKIPVDIVPLPLPDYNVRPPSWTGCISLCETVSLKKCIKTPKIQPGIEMCLLQDETGSFYDDKPNLVAAAPGIYNDVTAASPGATFGVAGFKDTGDAHVYKLYQGLTASYADWIAGVNALTASGGGDFPEAQYDGIVSAVTGTPYAEHCGWSGASSKKPVLVVTTDATFSTDPDIVNNMATTTSALTANGVTLIGLKAPGAGTELDSLATASGGSVQPLTSSGSNIATAVLSGLSALPTTVVPTPVGCAGLTISFSPPSRTVTSGGVACFEETIGVFDPSVAGTTINCYVDFVANGVSIGKQKISVSVPLDGVAVKADDTASDVCTAPDAVVTGKVTSKGRPVSGGPVTFKVLSGPNAGKGIESKTDRLGTAHFPYKSAKIGTDVIEFCYRDVYCDEVTRTWTKTAPPVASCVPDKVEGLWIVDGFDCAGLATGKATLADGSGKVLGDVDFGSKVAYRTSKRARLAKKAIPMKVEAGAGQKGVRAGDGPGETVLIHRATGSGDLNVVVTDEVGNVATAVCELPKSNSPGDDGEL